MHRLGKAIEVICHACWSIEFDGFERTHKRPSEAKAMCNRLVQIVGGAVSFSD